MRCATFPGHLGKQIARALIADRSGNPQRVTLRFRHIKIAIVTAAASTIKAGRISAMRAT